jgi:hypothetical protein
MVGAALNRPIWRTSGTLRKTEGAPPAATEGV